MKTQSNPIDLHRPGRAFRLPWLAALWGGFLGSATMAFGAFGVTTTSTYYTVDSGAGLVFRVVRANGGIDSIKLDGTELNNTTKASVIASGLGSTGTTTSVWSDANTVMVTAATDASNGVVAGMTHYYIVRKNENTIYMATHSLNEPGVGEQRWVTRLQSALFTGTPVESTVRDSTGAIESTDVFGMADGTTRSKYYGNQRAKDLLLRGVTGTGRGLFVAYGNRESACGGPFFRDIQNQSGSDTEVYNYMNSGHNQTEAWRTGVLHGPYALMFTDGSTPAVPDMGFIANLGLTGYVPASGRGAVSIPAITGRDASHAYTVGFANAPAQYWFDADPTSGAVNCTGMKPGSYTLTVYKNELSVYSATVGVTAGQTTALSAIALTGDPSRTVPLWRIGNWDGTPLEFLNGGNLTWMHPSDVRQASWTPGTYTVGTSTAATGFPACQWKDVNGTMNVSFNLTAAQLNACTVRIGITASYGGARPQIRMNTWSSAIPSPSSQPDSRSLTIGTYRGNNTLYTYAVPASALVAGTNTLTIWAVSGSGGTGYLSPGYAVDCVDVYPTSPGTVLDVPAIPGNAVALGLSGPGGVFLHWGAVAGAAMYEIRRASSAQGPWSVVAGGLTSTSWTDTDVAAGGGYLYRISAVNTSGTGIAAALAIDPSDRGTLFAASVARVPQGFTLTWPSATGVTFEIRRATTLDGPWAVIGSVTGTGSFTDTAPPAARAFYRVALVP
ncbi:rhamnogalacturonan lyase B N-terminal domain-containing protein [Luteolibacter sp. LG18]|uniref:rhamnogalacturonan lyase B N-terminal domain-containing protein n=1 Tax=Luteolibacter sp. LG18 TaxID=2819286 RepID=UPI0030C72D7A